MADVRREERLKEIAERAEKAHAMVHALCQPRGSSGSREWVMSIPARPDYDPDLVIGASLRDGDWLLSELSSADAEITRLRQLLGKAGEALEPFGRRKDALSISSALGHIDRGMIRRASELSDEIRKLIGEKP